MACDSRRRGAPLLCAHVTRRCIAHQQIKRQAPTKPSHGARVIGGEPCAARLGCLKHKRTFSWHSSCIDEFHLVCKTEFMSIPPDPFDPSTHRGSFSRSCGANGIPLSAAGSLTSKVFRKPLNHR